MWLALRAEFELGCVRGFRRVPASAFWRGYKKVDMQPDELLVSICVPALAGHMHFRKVGTRMAQSISRSFSRAGTRWARKPASPSEP